MRIKKKVRHKTGHIFFCCLLFIICCSLCTAIAFSEEIPCLSCHQQLNTPAKVVHAPMNMGCETCHQTNEGMKHPEQKGSIKLIQEIPALCYNCHENKTAKKVVHAPSGEGKCVLCHNSHASANTSLLSKDINTLCVGCHPQYARGTHVLRGFMGNHPMWKKPDPSRPGKEMSCASCHNPHSSDFSKLLPQAGLCRMCHKNK